MSDITVSPPRDRGELEGFLPVHRRTYLMSADDAQTWIDRVPMDLFRLVRRGDRVIGGLTLLPTAQWFGGRAVGMTGISSVGIEPGERAGGVGTAAMRAVVEELHASGVALSTLYPATQTVYRRCGWELAGDHIRYRLNTDDVDVRDREVAIDRVEDRDVIAAIYREHAQRTSGLLDRTDQTWRRVFEPWKREADAYVVSGAEGPEGYIVYSQASGEPMRTHLHADTVALTRSAARRILTFVADHRSFSQTFNWHGGPADVFNFLLAEPRRQVHLSWPWMLRIVDLRTALTERGYPSAIDAELHLRIDDDLIGDNNGPFILRVEGGKGDVKAGGAARLRVDIRGLAPLYTGYASPYELLPTGYLEGGEADLSAASAVFAGPAPWLPDFF